MSHASASLAGTAAAFGRGTETYSFSTSAYTSRCCDWPAVPVW